MIPQLLNWLVNSTPVLSTVNSIVSSSGRLFHYIGDPNSKASSCITHGVVRLVEVYGVVAYKSGKRN